VDRNHLFDIQILPFLDHLKNQHHRRVLLVKEEEAEARINTDSF